VVTAFHVFNPPDQTRETLNMSTTAAMLREATTTLDGTQAKVLTCVIHEKAAEAA
jgi:hypothetical protein